MRQLAAGDALLPTKTSLPVAYHTYGHGVLFPPAVWDAHEKLLSTGGISTGARNQGLPA